MLQTPGKYKFFETTTIILKIIKSIINIRFPPSSMLLRKVTSVELAEKKKNRRVHGCLHFTGPTVCMYRGVCVCVRRHTHTTHNNDVTDWLKMSKSGKIIYRNLSFFSPSFGRNVVPMRSILQSTGQRLRKHSEEWRQRLTAVVEDTKCPQDSFCCLSEDSGH